MSIEQVKDVLKNSRSIRSDVGCTIEYNMNSLIDDITVVSDTPDTTYVSSVNWQAGQKQYNLFKKLFPVDSIIKPFRPLYPGVKYHVYSTQDIPKSSVTSFRSVIYPGEGKSAYEAGAKPRVYYPGVTTSYKYWLSAKNTDVSINVNYKNSNATSKRALTNKIVVRFEKNHTMPTKYTVSIIKSNDTVEKIADNITPPASGDIVLAYNGSTWIKLEGSSSSVSSATYAAPISIKSIKLEAVNPKTNSNYIGVIELSARWVKDLSSDISDLQIDKQLSSNSSEGILPVGLSTSNSATINISKYNTSSAEIVDYVRGTEDFSSSLVYLVKNAEIRPYFKVYHSNGDLGSGNNKYDNVYQGVYYVDTYSISQYGDAVLSCLDGSKFLMDSFCPELLCENFPVTAIIRNLLDAVGFTNYNFNLLKDNTGTKSIDTSIPNVAYWWSSDTQTVWEAIQVLCRDIQMNAVFDDNNILQFYSRDYIYDSARSTAWSFLHEASGSTLPNIITLDKEEIAAGNSVKVLWYSPVIAKHNQSGDRLWKSPESYIMAGALKEAIIDSSTYFVMDMATMSPFGLIQSGFNFNGYVLIQSEIIEFDAMGYSIVYANSNTPVDVWITSASEIDKYSGLAKQEYINTDDIINSAYFKPNGKYRIKTREALNTKKADHPVSSEKTNDWTGQLVTWK